MEFDASALAEVRRSRLLIDQLDSWLFHLCKPHLGKRVLEVGCGYGNMLRHLVDRELVVGIDTDEASVEYVNSEFGVLSNVRGFIGDVTKPDFLEFSRHRFDTAISVNVLEHIENDEVALQNIHRVLTPAGCLILVVPAHNFLYGPMDEAIGHFRRYTKRTLMEKLARVGLEVRVQEYINPIGALGWLVNGRLLRRRVPPRSQLKLFNQLMPVVSKLQGAFHTGFGLSLLSISESMNDVAAQTHSSRT